MRERERKGARWSARIELAGSNGLYWRARTLGVHAMVTTRPSDLARETWT